MFTLHPNPPAPGPSYLDPQLDADVQRNYASVRAERGLTWSQMAEQFTRDGEPRLAAWATANARAEGVERGAAAPQGRSATAPDQQVAAAEAATPADPPAKPKR